MNDNLLESTSFKRTKTEKKQQKQNENSNANANSYRSPMLVYSCLP